MYHAFFIIIADIVLFVNRNRKSETKVPLLAFPLGGGVNEVDGCEVAIRQNGVSTAQNAAAQTDACTSYLSSVNFVRMFFGFAREIVGVQPTKKNSARRFASRTAHPLHRGAESPFLHFSASFLRRYCPV